MYSITQSKIIQQANQDQQFEQNPTYYHKNINYQQLSNELMNISKEVQHFVYKNQHRQSNKNRFLPFKLDQRTNLISKTIKKSYQLKNNQKNDQINNIIANTQGLIKWISQSQQKAKIVTLNLSNKSKKIIPKMNQTMDIPILSNKGSIQYKRQIHPKTVNIYEEKYLNSAKINRKQPVMNRIFFDKPIRNSHIQSFDQFDDKQTVINQPTKLKKGCRSYKPTIQDKNIIENKQVKISIPKKPSKTQILFQQMSKLQSQLNQLKRQKLFQQFSQIQSQSKLINSKPKQQNLQQKAVYYVNQRDRRHIKRYLSDNKKSQNNLEQSGYKDKRKISLKNWVQDYQSSNNYQF